MFSNNRHSHLWSVLIVALIAFVYLVTLAPPAVSALSAGPVYRLSEGVALECAVRWNAQSVPQLVELAEREKVPVTFFVTQEYADENPDLLEKMRGAGCDAGLLVLSKTRADILSELQEGARVFSSLGMPLRFVMADRDKNADLLDAVAAKEGLCTVLSSFDLLNRSTSGETLIRRVEKECFDGAIIRFEPTKTIAECFGGILEALREQGCVPQTLDSLLS